MLPPICQGDLASAIVDRKPRAVLIVDGEFGQSMSVWHKEILHALHLGVRVIGASSMGALRAAELGRFGMEGVGAIYEYYRDGWLTSDADVALLYDEDYRPLTWPLVNVRATVQDLLRRDLLVAEDAEALLQAAQGLHFSERRERRLAERVAALGVAPARAAELARLVTVHYVDQKALDATAGFEYLARIDRLPAPDSEEPLHRDGRGFQPLLWSDVTIRRQGTELRRYQLVDDVALHHPDFDCLLERAANRYLVAYLAREAGVSLNETEISDQRARTLRRLGLDDEGLEAWLADNDLEPEAFDGLIEHEALNTRMRRWLLDTRLYERNRRLVIEQLQLEGEYAAAADAAARRRALADSRPTPEYPAGREALVDLLVRQMTISAWKPDTELARFADERGFDTLGGLLVALSDSVAANLELQERRRRVGQLLGLTGNGSAPPPPARLKNPAARTHALLEAHQVTQVLLTAVELGIPGALAQGPRTSSELALRTGTQRARLARLLAALCATNLVTCEEDRWSLTPDGRALVPTGQKGEETLAAYAEHVRSGIFPAWAALAGVIRGGEAPSYPVDELSDRSIASATGALGVLDAVSDTLALPDDARVADIGGGLGYVAQTLLARQPDLSLVVVELPGTAERARARLGALPIEVVAFAGQPRLEPLVDSCLLVRVLVTLDDERAVDLLGFARRSLHPGGRIEVVDLEADGSPAAAFGDLLNLARSGGAVRSRQQWRDLGQRAGLELTARAAVVAPFVYLTFRTPA